MITKYRIYESNKYDIDMLNDILILPLNIRNDLKRFLQNKLSGNINESIFNDIKFRFKNWIHEKILLWLINQSDTKLENTIDTLNLFDPTDFSNVKKCEVIYLGGGIDKTPDEYIVNPIKSNHPISDIGTRYSIFSTVVDKIKKHIPDKLKDVRLDRFVFIVDRGTILDNILNDYEIEHIELIAGGGSWRYDIEKKFKPENIVGDIDLMVIERTGKINLNKYDKPLIINPLRKEQSVRDDKEFKRIYNDWKSGKIDKEINDDRIKYMSKIVNRDIKQPDLRLLNVCDTNLVKYDYLAGDGTKGELQFGALKNYMNIFLWLDGGYTIKDISLWTFPEITKIIRNNTELDLLITSIKNLNKK